MKKSPRQTLTPSQKNLLMKSKDEGHAKRFCVLDPIGPSHCVDFLLSQEGGAVLRYARGLKTFVSYYINDDCYSKIHQGFQADNKDHVTWLASMCTMAEKMADPMQNIRLVDSVNKNPMKVVLDKNDALDWPQIHFVLCATYAKAVLRGQAWIPPKN